MLRRELPVLLTLVVGFFMVLGPFIPARHFTDARTEFEGWAIIITSFAAVLGVANIARLSVLRISRRERDWLYHVPLLAGLALMMVLGVGGSVAPAPIFGIQEGTLFNDLYNHMYVPMQGTMFALLAFYIASAAFRAFRIRSFEAMLLAVAAVLVMIGRVPIGASIWDGLPQIADWIMNIPNNAAKRAILIGAALGAIATGLKVILGLERNYLGGE
jgi:hypothetical protein